VITSGATTVVPPHRPSYSTLSIRGADISFAPQEEAAGNVFSDAGKARPVEQLFADHGASYVRLRVWLSPPAGYSDEASALALARRARASGLKILLDLHYADFWADATSQETPGAWRGQQLPALAHTVRAYTSRVVADFARQGTPVDIVQIGNEITAGILWPTGRVYRPDGEQWEPLAALLDAGIAGARQGNPGNHRLSVMLHIDRGGDNAGCRYFFDHIISAGVTDFDMIGLTYYPFWNGSLADLRANLADLAPRYDRPLVIAETAYPWTMNGTDAQMFVRSASQLQDAKTYPPTAQGQAAYFTALRRVLGEVPGSRGAGFLAWEPEWIDGVGAKPGEGNPYSNLTMFDRQGRALPSLGTAFQPLR
jgi:arabinogalactan endo-1,4-beta-galactosidase